MDKDLEKKFVDHKTQITSKLEELIEVINSCGVAGIEQEVNGYKIEVRLNSISKEIH